MTQQQKASLLAMIEKATSGKEVDRLAKILETGEFPEEGLDGREEKVKVKNDDHRKEDGKEMVENGPSATVDSVPSSPQREEKTTNNIDMKVEEQKSSTTTTTPSTTPTKAQAKRKGKGRTPTRKAKAAAADPDEKEGSKESAATVPKAPPPTPTTDNDNKVRAMDAESHGTSDHPTLTKTEIKAMTVAVLKKTLKARDEPTTGLKKELQARLLVSCGHAAD